MGTGQGGNKSIFHQTSENLHNRTSKNLSSVSLIFLQEMDMVETLELNFDQDIKARRFYQV